MRASVLRGGRSIARGGGAWYTLTACSTGQGAMRDVGAPVRAEEASAPRQAQRRANVQGVGDFQEGAETSAYVRIAAGDGGVEWAQVRALLARDTRTPMGRERALGLLPTQDLEAITHALALAAPPPWEIIPDVRPTLDAVRVPGAVADGVALAAMLPLLDAATRLTGYGRGIREAAADLAAAFDDLPTRKSLADLLRRSLAEDGRVVDEASPALRRIRSRLRD